MNPPENFDLVEGPAGQPERSLPETVERHCLTFSWFLLSRGGSELLDMIRRVVTDRVAPISLKEPFSLSDLEDLLLSLRSGIDSLILQDEGTLCSLLLPAEGTGAEEAFLKDSSSSASAQSAIDEEPQSSDGLFLRLEGKQETKKLPEPPLIDPILRGLLNSMRDYLER